MPASRPVRTEPLASPTLHRRLVQVGATLEVLVACFLISGPLLIPDFPILPKVLGMAVPIIYQRTAVALMGTTMLVEGILLMSLSPMGWWMAMILGPLGVLDGLIGATRFWPTLLDILLLFYLYYVREVFFAPPPGAR
jgi:hypothetical protein